MKNRTRPPLNLTAPEAETAVHDAAGAPDVSVEGAPQERPMSERRRRRLAEEAARREAEVAEPATPRVDVSAVRPPAQPFGAK